MKKLFMIFALALFLVSFASAGHTYVDYSHPDEIVVRKTIVLNENRFPTYDYRHGYTYRSTDEYIYGKTVSKYPPIKLNGYHGGEIDYVKRVRYSGGTKTGVYYQQGYKSDGTPRYVAEYSYDRRRGDSYERDYYYRDVRRSSDPYYYERRYSSWRDYDHHRHSHDYDWDYYEERADYYYEYVPYLKKTVTKKCYHEGRSNSLFYIRCP